MDLSSQMKWHESTISPKSFVAKNLPCITPIRWVLYEEHGWILLVTCSQASGPSDQTTMHNIHCISTTSRRYKTCTMRWIWKAWKGFGVGERFEAQFEITKGCILDFSLDTKEWSLWCHVSKVSRCGLLSLLVLQVAIASSGKQCRVFCKKNLWVGAFWWFFLWFSPLIPYLLVTGWNKWSGCRIGVWESSREKNCDNYRGNAAMCSFPVISECQVLSFWPCFLTPRGANWFWCLAVM